MRRGRKKAKEGDTDKSIKCRCFSDLCKLTHRAPLCGEVLASSTVIIRYY